MLATLIIGLREGLEAALIVGIIAAFLRRQQRRDALRWMWIGVIVAILICVAVAIGLEVLSRDLPQQQQEALETVIGAIAVAMVTYMIVWMREHSRDLKGDLESAASEAMANGSAFAFVLMAFLAVLREGLETAVFLVAAFNASGNAVPSAAGAILGIAIAVALGYGIYRGGVHINLARFFKITGLLLVLVAAGLVMTALHTAHEAGWLDVGQQQVVDLSWLVRPGSVQSSLLTGVLGLQPKPVLIEVLGWLIYVVVVGTIVLWPAGRAFPRRLAAIATGACAAALAIAALVVFLTAPATPTLPSSTLATPATGSPTTSGILSGTTVQVPADVSVSVSKAGADSATGVLTSGAVTTPLERLSGGETTTFGSLSAPTFDQVVTPNLPITALVPDAPTRVSVAQIVAGNGGRLPVGLDTRRFGESAPVVYVVSASVTVSVDPYFNRPLAADVRYAITATATPEQGSAVVLGKVATFETGHQPTAADLAALGAANDQRNRHHSQGVTVPLTLTVIAAVLAVLAALLAMASRRRPTPSTPSTPSAPVSGRGDPTTSEPSGPDVTPDVDPAAVVAPPEKKERTR
ncbi:FTR1 family protein [Gordonia sp. L191]|uniref:iron uptake transporter permease EfeU n=1 Tax=Gordonia sp. L191 TaxID=2982699 RepID=UPI0024BFBA16|nr:iron uptake transporter permease EfeU [Gordonia sp. L191]WHU45636.1 FTR1 family protein [Gordonia sp. L191]